MPFGEGFDEIYNLFIVSAISEAGYRVVRADDIRSHQNILKDVLSGLTESDVVVADLTGSNPNVYYELGLAHAFHKRVILLTQHVDDLPFDLRSYRVIPYSTHFAEIARARAQLIEAAKDALDERIPFGSPVSDFLSGRQPGAPALTPLADIGSDSSLEDEGILDHLVHVEEGFARLAEILAANTAEMTSVTESIDATAERLSTLTRSNSPAGPRRAVVVSHAKRLSDYAESLGHHNDDYGRTLASTRTSLESVIRQTPATEKEREAFRTFLNQLDSAEQSSRTQQAGLSRLIEAIRSTPRIERTLNRASNATILSLEGYAQNVDQTLSMIVRARELVKSRLSE